MGCDIHAFAEMHESGEWQELPVPGLFNFRSYSVFGWLANVRNYSAVTPISAPRGLPDDASEAVKQHYEDMWGDAHSATWLAVNELTTVDYTQLVEDRRCDREIRPGFIDGGCTCEPGEGEMMTLREFLGPGYFTSLDLLSRSGAKRIVFWFDN